MEDGGRVKGRDDEAANVGNEENDVRIRGRVGVCGLLVKGCSQPVLALLVGQFHVDKGGNGLDGAAVLGVIEKVAQAGSELGMPLEDVVLTFLEGLERALVLLLVLPESGLKE